MAPDPELVSALSNGHYDLCTKFLTNRIASLTSRSKGLQNEALARLLLNRGVCYRRIQMHKEALKVCVGDMGVVG